jgi:hypothetical protein
MRVIKTDVVKKVKRTILKENSLGARIIMTVPIYFQFPEGKLKQCLRKLRRTTPQLKNKLNRESWKRIIKTGELLLQGKTPGGITTILELVPSTIKCYLQHLDYQMNKI